ncbi:MAG: DUF1735 domain-containing protein [Mediterranea massiliensis]|nr:DUF1735 domain-containing protein [Mediterranea massiliensis]
MKKILFILLAITGCIFTSCENQDWDFPDFEYTTVYFAYQTPVRTITFGEDIWDTSLDNQGQCQIMATIGGVYSNEANRTISIEVDPTIVDDVTFKDGSEIVAMPSNYYTLSDSKIVIPAGKLLGGVTVQLTDAFFADPEATTGKYVIPVRMTGVQGADSILSGVPLTDSPRLAVAEDWDVQPKNYVLYAVKYISQYDSWYLRTGTDVYSDARGTVERKYDDIEKAQQVNTFSTLSKNSIVWNFDLKDEAGYARDCKLKFDFTESGAVSISSLSSDITASGSGQYTVLGEKNSWGGKDRDVMTLDYTISWPEIIEPIGDGPLTGYRAQNGAKIEAVEDGGNYKMIMSNETAGANMWDAQVFIKLASPMKANTQYKLSCKAKASSAYDAQVFLIKAADGAQAYPWPQTLSFSAEEGEASMTFSNSDDASEVIINFGTFAGSISTDDWSLVPVDGGENIIQNSTFDGYMLVKPAGTVQITDKLVQWSRGVASEWFEVAAK